MTEIAIPTLSLNEDLEVLLGIKADRQQLLTLQSSLASFKHFFVKCPRFRPISYRIEAVKWLASCWYILFTLADDCQLFNASVSVFSTISGLITVHSNGMVHSINNSFAVTLLGYNSSELVNQVMSAVYIIVSIQNCIQTT